MAGKTTKKTASVNTKVEAVRRFFADSKAANHPIKEHPVSKAEEYVRDLYLDMLCVVAQYECIDTENGFTLIRRIMAACENTQPLEEYIKRSMEITPERTAEFIKQCKDNGLCEIFMVDSMLLSCSNGSPNAKQVGFIAQFGDMLGFDKNTLAALAELAYVILGNDDFEQLAQAAKKLYELSLDLKFILCYAAPITDKKIKRKGNNLYYYSLTPVELNEELLESQKVEDGELKIKNLDSIVFRNIIIKFPIRFSAVKRVSFIDCQFTYMGFAVICENVENVEVINCKAQDIEVFLCVDDGSPNITINNSSFYDCGEVVAKKISSLTLESCQFSSCNPMYTDSIFPLEDSRSPIIHMSDCNFIKCEGSYLFTNYENNIEIKGKNNSFTGCCPITKSIK